MALDPISLKTFRELNPQERELANKALALYCEAKNLHASYVGILKTGSQTQRILATKFDSCLADGLLKLTLIINVGELTQSFYVNENHFKYPDFTQNLKQIIRHEQQQ